MSARYGRLATRFSAAVVLGLLIAALSAHSRSQAVLQSAFERSRELLANAGLATPPASSLIVDIAPEDTRPYVLPNLHGEAFDFGGLILRTLLPNTTSSGALSIMGVSSGELPLALAHYHEEVEAFYTLKGTVEVFHNDDQGREVRANDFVLLAPRNVHNYRPIDLDFQLTLCMAPGGIDDFFRTVGEPYNAAGPFDPIHQAKPNPAKILGNMPKYNITPKPGYGINMNWTNGTTEDAQRIWHRRPQALPTDDKTAYFIASNRGPKFLHRATGQVIAQLTTGVQTKGLLSVASIAVKPGPRSQKTSTFTADHAMQVTEGQLHLEIDGAVVPLIFGDFAFVPRGTPFRYWSTVNFTKFVVWSAGNGLVEALVEQSEAWTHGVWAP